MKSFKQYITEVERYESGGGWEDVITELAFDALELAPGLIGRFGGLVGTILGTSQTIGNPTWPPIPPLGNPPWHSTNPNNSWDNPPPGWKRVGGDAHPYRFEYVPYPQDGYAYEWNPSNGTWKRVDGPPALWQEPEEYEPGIYDPEPPPNFSPFQNMPNLTPNPDMPFNPNLGKPRNPEIGPYNPPGFRKNSSTSRKK